MFQSCQAKAKLSSGRWTLISGWWPLRWQVLLGKACLYVRACEQSLKLPVIILLPDVTLSNFDPRGKSLLPLLPISLISSPSLPRSALYLSTSCAVPKSQLLEWLIPFAVYCPYSAIIYGHSERDDVWVFNCKPHMRLEAEGNRELRLNPVRPQSIKWELHGKKMKTDSYLSRRRKKSRIDVIVFKF